MNWNLDYDAVLLGSGAGSLSAALALHDRGLKPIIIEKSGLIGGATAYSGGIVWVPCNHRMKLKGNADSLAEALDYLNTISLGRGDPAIAEAYVNAAPRIIEALEKRTALRWATYPGLPDYYAEAPGGKTSGRYLMPHSDLIEAPLIEAASRWKTMQQIRPCVHLRDRQNEWIWGRGLIGCLWAQILADGIHHMLACRATSLVAEGGRVIGITAETSDGTVTIRAKHGVLLNTGGFDWNEELTRRHLPGVRLFPHTPPANEGDGHLMAAEHGAAFALMDQSIGMPSICVPGEMNDGEQLYRILFQELALPHSMVVNAKGRRFANETFFVDVTRAWNAIDERCLPVNLPSYLIFDMSYVKQYGFPGGPPSERIARSEADIRSLAKAVGIDDLGLWGEINDYNQQIANGGSDRFSRGSTAYQRAFGDTNIAGNPTIGPITTPPYFAIQLHPATSSHRGGMIIDTQARVLNTRGNVIPGLFACGACAAGTLTGGTYFSGAAVGHSIVFGTLAAAAMATTASSSS